ncbi:MAG: GLPGLI family protein [Bacteroidota bacterium]|nr:GLPGLI family protein [Bacteroidota bacterium]
MKRLLMFLSVLTCLGAVGQELRGVVTYQSRNALAKLDLEDQKMEGVSDDMKKMIADEIRKASEKTYTLNFDKNTSVYEEVKELDIQESPMAKGLRIMTGMTDGGKCYKNLTAGEFVQERDLFGKQFLVKDKIIKFEWELTSETKLIGEYVCYKATAPNNFDGNVFLDMVEEEKKKQDNTGFLSRMEKDTPKVITAWYTPQIPVSNGPSYFGGLPGLILEINDGESVILCSQLVINPKNPKEIKAPKKGKEVTLEEYNKEFKQTMEELQKMMPSK